MEIGELIENENKWTPSFYPRIGIWLPKTTTFCEGLSIELKRQTKNIDLEIAIYDGEQKENFSEDVCIFLSKLDSVCLVGANFNYVTHLEKSKLRKDNETTEEEYASSSPKSSMESPIRSYCFPDSSDDELHVEDTLKAVLVLIIFPKEDLRTIPVLSMRNRIFSTVESFKAFNPNLKLMLVMNGLRSHALQGFSETESRNKSKLGKEQLPQIHASILDEVICQLLIEYQVDTIETEDEVELAQFLVDACLSIELCYHRKVASNFRGKPHGYKDEELPKLTKTWITQLLQIPEVGKDAAKAIASVYHTPAEVIESIRKSPETFIESLKNLTINSRNPRKLGVAIARRVTMLYSQDVVPNARVLECGK